MREKPGNLADVGVGTFADEVPTRERPRGTASLAITALAGDNARASTPHCALPSARWSSGAAVSDAAAAEMAFQSRTPKSRCGCRKGAQVGKLLEICRNARR
jgi:hypothetical protein